MVGHPASTSSDTLTIVDERLYWISEDGAALSVSVTAPAREARQEWRLPTRQGNRQRATVNGTVVAYTDYETTATYAEYDLLTGRQLRNPIELPWLKAALKDNAGSTVLGVASVPG
jgi:hypothetical protein